MDFKMKENVNFDSFVLRKKILGETLEIISTTSNYTITDLSFYLMISFVDALVEENVVVYCLSDEEKLTEKLETIIEPLFFEKIKSDTHIYGIYEELLDELIDYMEREHENGLSVAGILSSVIDALSGIDYQKLLDMVNNTIEEKTSNEGVDTKNKEVKILTAEEAAVESDKMKALINQFTVKKEDTIK